MAKETHNRTVREMDLQAKKEKLSLYIFTKDQADTVFRGLGHQADDEPFLSGDVGKELQDKGGLHGKLARFATKWMRSIGSTTTIPLTVEEHKEVSKLAGEKLSPA